VAARHCRLEVISCQVVFGGGWFASDPAKRPVSVTVVDPKTGKREPLVLPAHGSEEAKRLWKPLIDALIARLKRKGLEKTLTFGIGHCGGIHKDVRAQFKELAPGAGWHLGKHPRPRRGQHSYADYVEYLYVGAIPPPEKERHHGWKRGDQLIIMCQRIYDAGQSTVTMRTMAERALLLGDNGSGRICLDYWPVKGSSRHGGRESLYDRWPTARANQRCPHLSYLAAPGLKGATSTIRTEALIEGLQEAEARVFLERAIDGKELPDELAARAQKLLDARVTFCRMTHGGGTAADRAVYGSGWRADSAALYRLAAEASAAISK
jgi:hypothetical protein